MAPKKKVGSPIKKQTPKPTLCETCAVYVPSGGLESHNAGKKHKHREAMQNKKKAAPTAVHQGSSVNNNKAAYPQFNNKNAGKGHRTLNLHKLPPGTLEVEIIDYFSQFGPVSSARIFKGQPQGNVAFESAFDFTNILSQKHILRGKEIQVASPLQPVLLKEKREFFPKNDISRGKFVYEKIMGLPIHEQIEKFVDIVSLTAADITDRIELVTFISTNLQEFFPGCSLQIFGSTVSGLGFRGCDIDISLFLPNERPENQSLVLRSNRVPSIIEVRNGMFPRHELCHLSRENILHFLLKFILKLPSFKFARFIPSARCPIVKFHHLSRGSNTCGDISFSKGLGLANTRLLRLYSQLDFRVKALLMILRFWGKRENIVGSNHMITSYAFSWLVIFFLQSINMVPTLETLASLADEKKLAETWDCTFCEDKSKIPLSSRMDTVAELLTKFFGYYACFDFTVNVICPRDGSIIPKTKLVELAGEDLDFHITDLSVQDVFDLTHNITAGVNVTTIQTFILQCGLQHGNWIGMENRKDFSLKCLFYPRAVPPNLQPRKHVPEPKEQVTSFMATLSDYSLQLPLKSKTKTEYSVEKMSNFVLDVFRRVFLFDCIVTEYTSEDSYVNDPTSSSLKRGIEQNNGNSKRMKTSDGINTRGEVVLLAICNVYRRVWTNRKLVKGFISTTPGVSQMEIEESISKEIAKQEEGKQRFCLHMFEAEFSVCDNHLKIALIPKNDKPELLNTILPYVKKMTSMLAMSCLNLDMKIKGVKK